MTLSAHLVHWTLLVCLLRLGRSDSIHHVNRWIAMATCQARCLTLYGEELKRNVGDADIFQPYTCNTHHCKQCSAPCDWKLIGETRCEDDCVDKKCGHSCLVLYRSLRNLRRTTLHGNGIIGTEHLRDTEDGIRIERPELVCKDTPPESLPNGQYRSELYVRWKVTEKKRINVAVVFVLALRKKKPGGHHSRWTIIGKTPYSIFHAKHLVAGAEYQLRVTPVTGAGYAGKDAISHWISTMPGGHVGNPPLLIHMIDQKLEHDDMITATFEITPANDQSCYFKVFWSSDRNDGYEELFLSKPWTNTRLRIEGLYFNRNYTLSMHAFSRGFRQEGDATDVKFATATCLEATGHDFEKCAPGPPLMSRYSHLRSDKDHASIRITWVPPQYASSSNIVTGYIVDWKQIVTADRVLTTTHDEWTELPGNINGLVLTNLHKDSVYEVQLRTKSTGGIGPPLFIIFRTNGIGDSPGRRHRDRHANKTIAPEEREVGTQIAIPWEVYLLIPLLITLIVLVILMCLRHFRVKKAHDLARHWTNIQEESNVYSLLNTNSGKGTTTALISHDKYEIHLKCLLLHEMISDGKFSVVKRAELTQNTDDCREASKEVAVKILKDSATEFGRSKFLREMNALKRLGTHQNIACIIGCCSEGPHTWLVLELCPLGDLHSYLRRIYKKKLLEHTSDSFEDIGIFSPRHGTDQNNEGSLLPSKEDHPSLCLVMSYASQIATGMEYICSRGVVHGELAACNILLSDVRTAKVSGFGLACGLDQQIGFSPFSGVRNTYKWLSPEAMGSEQCACTTKMDVWAFGVTLWELVTLGASPYVGISCTDLPNMLKKGYRLSKPEECSDSCYGLMVQCWLEEPELRPTFAEICAEIDAINRLPDSNIYLGKTLINDSSSENNADMNLSSDELKPPAYEEVISEMSPMLISPRAASLNHYAPTMTSILDMEEWSSDEMPSEV